MFGDIAISALSLGGLGLFLGGLLAVASLVFKVDTDERIEQITQLLPGANCGGCGFSGCGALAQAIVDGAAAVNACPVGGDDTMVAIGEIMGVSPNAAEKRYARVMCNGTCGAAEVKYEYSGVQDCAAAVRLAGGPKQCGYGCMGLGTCVRQCKFGAISIQGGIARIDSAKCTACGMCVSACPKQVIEMMPARNSVWVECKSRDKGALVKDYCLVGCIGCKMCEKACTKDAIKVNDFVAKVDYSRCTNCGACIIKCPKKIIKTSNHKMAERLSAMNEK